MYGSSFSFLFFFFLSLSVAFIVFIIIIVIVLITTVPVILKFLFGKKQDFSKYENHKFDEDEE